MNWRRIQQQLLRHRKPVTEATPTYNGKRCWEFDGCLNPDGYGKIRLTDVESKERPKPSWIEYVHRASAAAFKRFDLNSDLIVDHECENTCCFNPFHLKPKTQSVNVMEGRHGRGESKPLTLADVDALRRYVHRRKGSANIAKWAASRGFMYSAVRKAVLGINYAEAPPQALLPFGKIARPIVRLPKRKPFQRIKDDCPF